MLGNLVPSVQQKVLDQMSQRPKLIVLDTMNFWMDNCLDDLLEALKNVDVLTINDEEAQQLSGENNLISAAKKIKTMGPKYLVIKKGEHGALLFGENKMFYAPAMPLENVFDPTGAGDSFAGGFIGYLSKLNDLNFDNMKTAVIYGSVMASFCVEKFGTEKLTEITQEDVKRRADEFVSLSNFKL
jgi:sugar/nucleoside kinase (ribokinase family)